ncbi:MAG: pimelyl-ACP methyl ester esterase BioV [Epsilonproteobacteria bacterium]|nr:pimelyl-ACP methyl ester esterase BioV [Campylobacterota bacterium]
MKFFSGFCFKDESELFSEYICHNDFCVAGFSYGAIKAFEYALNYDGRIDKLQLFSPVFFHKRSDKFKRLQTINFSKNSDLYIKNFLKQVVYPSDIDMQKYFKKGNLKELKELLNHMWDTEKLEKLAQRGIEIEIFLGEKDKIINTNNTLDFFLPHAQIYYIKNVGHLIID